MHHLILVWFGWLKDGGYLGIVALMAMESSIFPVPSEMVIPPAAVWAAQGKLSFWGVVAAGTFGSWLGSAISYGLALWLGRIVIVRWGGYFFISEKKLEGAERFLHRYEAGGIFFARLLPVVRHLISIPAGIVRMNFAIFSAMTVAGAFVWCTVLAWFGMRVARDHPDFANDPDKMVGAIKAESMPIVIFVILFCLLYIVAIRLTGKRPDAAQPPAPGL